MANETGFENSTILLFEETTEGETPATIAVGYAAKALEFSFDINQRTEENVLLGAGGQPSKVDTGGEDPSGSIGLKCTPDADTLTTNWIVGRYTTKTTLNDAHATSTAYTADDVVILGGTDTLYCKTGGTSETTDTALLAAVLAASTGDEVTDGTVTWVVTKGKTAMYEYTCPLSKDVPSLGQIITDATTQGGGVTTKVLGRGLNLTNKMFGKESGMVIAKNTHSTVAHGAIPSTASGYTAPTVTSTVTLADNAYKRDDICVTIDGVAVKQIETLTFTLETATTVEDAVSCMTVAGVQVSEKITTKGIPSLKGTASIRFSVEEWAKAVSNTEQEVVITYAKQTGEKTVYTLPRVQLIDPKRKYDTSKPIVIDNTLSAYGDSTTPALTVTVRSFLNYTK
jgi:uncharacterized protein YdeI (BOF family)